MKPARGRRCRLSDCGATPSGWLSSALRRRNDPGISDEVILTQANSENAVLVTADKDFGELVFRQRRIHAGVVLLRLSNLHPQAKVDLVSRALQDHVGELPGAFTVITPGAVRIRRAR